MPAAETLPRSASLPLAASHCLALPRTASLPRCFTASLSIVLRVLSMCPLPPDRPFSPSLPPQLGGHSHLLLFCQRLWCLYFAALLLQILRYQLGQFYGKHPALSRRPLPPPFRTAFSTAFSTAFPAAFSHRLFHRLSHSLSTTLSLPSHRFATAFVPTAFAHRPSQVTPNNPKDGAQASTRTGSRRSTSSPRCSPRQSSTHQTPNQLISSPYKNTQINLSATNLQINSLPRLASPLPSHVLPLSSPGRADEQRSTSPRPQPARLLFLV